MPMLIAKLKQIGGASPSHIPHIAALHEHEVSAFVGDQAGDGGNAGLADSRARDYCAGRSLADHLAAMEARFVGL